MTQISFFSHHDIKTVFDTVNNEQMYKFINKQTPIVFHDLIENPVHQYLTQFSKTNFSLKKFLFFRNDSLVLTRVFSHRSYISEKRIYQKFISKIMFT